MSQVKDGREAVQDPDCVVHKIGGVAPGSDLVAAGLRNETHTSAIGLESFDQQPRAPHAAKNTA